MVTDEPRRWALIKDGAVYNVCLWNGDTSQWSPPMGVDAVPAPDDVAIGWVWANGEFAPPPAPSDEEPSA
ncbi:MAG: hypothetical protein U1E62_05390 [Alsobacter sp.]